MITVAVLLLISFSTFFPGLKFKDNWEKANLLVAIKDITLTIDRTGKLYEFSFYREKLDDFLSSVFTKKNVVWWSGTEGATKPIITIACNCSDEEIGNLTSWFNNLVVNKRNITIFFVKSKLTDISDQTDGLIIFGYKNLTPYASYLDAYVAKGKGIVYIADLTDVDAETKKIFGIDLCSKTLPSCGWATTSNITFLTPTNASVANYEAWKLFFHFPETIKAKYEQDSVPLDSNVQACAAFPVYNGTIKLRGIDYNFWTCNETSRYKLYLDTDGNGKADKAASLGETFKLGDSTFNFSYVIDNKTIAIAYQRAPVSYGFKYKRPITIDNTRNSNTLTDYQVLVTVDTASLISAGKMRSDCGDIRFTDSDGTTQLNYWLESGCNSASTKIWVKVPSIPARTTKTIYMYYGNPLATSVSNGVATFELFDDFDPDKITWTRLAGTWSNVVGYQGNSKKGVHDGTAGARKSLLGPRLALADFVLHAKVRSTVDNSIANIVFRAADNTNDGNNRIWVRLDQRAVNWYYHYGGFHCLEDVNGREYVRGYYDFSPVVGQWYDVMVKVHGTTVEGFLDGAQKWTATVSRTAAGYLLLQVEYQSGHDAWFDNLFIRKYTSPEPRTSVGTETTLATGTTYGSYNFTDFLKDGGTRIYLTDKNVYRIVVHRGNYSNSNYPVPAATVNPAYKSAWIANFARNGFEKVGDDEKQLLLSLLLYAADKSYRQGNLFKIGYQLPYINVKNDDMYEVYRFYLGLGYPY